MTDFFGDQSVAAGKDATKNAKDPLGKSLGMATTVIGGIGQISEGLQAYSMSKLNEASLKRQGKQAFSDHMASVRQQVSSYVQQQAGTGLVANRDISWGATAKGARDAAQKQYAFDVQAAQEEYAGRSKKIEGITKGITSISSAFAPV